jgi:hypothetical protein
LADTRGLQQDELHNTSIEKQIKEHIDSVTAVLVLANGTVPRVTAGTDYALSTLSAISPRTPPNVAFVLTNTSTALDQNFSRDTLPDVFKHAPHFLLNNPIALQRRYLELKDNPNMESQGSYFRETVKASEQGGLEMLVELFDWLGSLEPRPTTKILPLYKQCQRIVAKVTGPLARQAKELQGAFKDKVEAGVRRVNRILIGASRQVRVFSRV